MLFFDLSGTMAIASSLLPGSGGEPGNKTIHTFHAN